jgi:hypothetical protein
MATDFTIADVLAWARTKPADERYDYEDSGNCALCQYLREVTGDEEPSVGSTIYYPITGGVAPLPDWANDAAVGDGKPKSHTFGLFVKRLEALSPDTPVTQSNWSAIDAYLCETVSA